MFRWYVINTYSGHENKVKANLEHRIVSMNQAPRFRRVVAGAGRVLARRVGQGNLRPALRLRRRGRRRQPGPAEAEGSRRHLRAPGPGRADLRPGEEAGL